MWKHFVQACAKTLWLELVNVPWISISLRNTKDRKIIVELNKTFLNNVVVVTQYGNDLYTQANGLITSANNSVSLANSTVQYILQPTDDVLREVVFFRRFVDDVIWITASEMSNERIWQERTTSAFAHHGLEITFL